MPSYQGIKDYLKDNWGDYVTAAALAGAIIASATFALDGNRTKLRLESEIRKEKAKKARLADANKEIERGFDELLKKIIRLDLKEDEIFRNYMGLSQDYGRPNARIAGFVQEPEDWSILPRPKNCRERKGRLYFQLGEKDIIGKTKHGNYLIEFRQDGPGFDLIGVKIGESGWSYGRPGKPIQARMSGEDFERHVEGKHLEIQVMGLNGLPQGYTEKSYVVRGSYKGVI